MEVVIGVLSNQKNQLLIGRRSHGAYKLCWEFPGGKVESGETRFQALRREWMEELGLSITVGECLFEGQIPIPTIGDITAIAYQVFCAKIFDAPPMMEAHDVTWWASKDDILSIRNERVTPSLLPILLGSYMWSTMEGDVDRAITQATLEGYTGDQLEERVRELLLNPVQFCWRQG